MAPGTACRAPRRLPRAPPHSLRSPPLAVPRPRCRQRRASSSRHRQRRPLRPRRRTSFRRPPWRTPGGFPGPSAASAAAPGCSAEPVPVPPSAAATGRMLIRSSPSGEVRVNGVVRGETPVVLRDLPFGRYSIAVTRPGFATIRARVDLLASQPSASLSLDLVRQGVAGSGTAPVARPSPPPAPEAEPGVAPAVAAPAAPATAAAPSPPRHGPRRRAGVFVQSVPRRARLFIDGQAYGTRRRRFRACRMAHTRSASKRRGTERGKRGWP